jgi:predicted NBD/HSP70 family sugar kinase
VLKADAPAAPTAWLIGEGAAAGDGLALKIWRGVGEKLSEALVVLVDVLNPDRIVIGGSYARCERFIAPAMSEVLTLGAWAMSKRAITRVRSKRRSSRR